MKRKFWSIILVLILLVTAAAPAGTLTAAASDAVEEALSLPDNEISENEELTDAADNGEIIDSEDSADAADNGEIINPEDSAVAAEETEPDADEADEVISEEIISPDEAGEQKIEAGEQEDDPAKTGPEDIWEAIFALEKEREVYTPEEHEALFPEIEQIILSSPSYREDTIEYRDGTLFWRDDDCLNGYCPELRARENGYIDAADTSPEMKAMFSALEAQVAEEIAQQKAETVQQEAEMAEQGILTEMAGSGYDVGVFLPYDGYDGGENFYAWESIADTAAYFTGGSVTAWKGSNATVDRLAALVRDCAVVLIGSHGHNGTFTIHSGSGITDADKNGGHAWNNGGGWSIDGTAIANHMTKNAGECLVISASCEGMKTDALCAPLRNKGVDVVFGFSESVSCSGADIFTLSFIRNLGFGKTVAEAFRDMKVAAGCDWDPLYYNLTLEEAQMAEVAFPIVVSAQDSYPGEGNVNIVQNVKSTWKAPKKVTQYTMTDWLWTTETITKGTSVTIEARADTTEKYTKVSRDDANLPPGMYQTWSQEKGIKIYGTPTKKGLYQTQHKITTESGKIITHNFKIMVRDAAVTTRSTQTITFTAENVEKWTSTVAQNTSNYWYQSLNFNPDDMTYSMKLISGYIPSTLYYGFSEGSYGYIRSENYVGYSGYYYATVPGTYSGTFEIISYSGSVYRLPVKIVVKPAHTYNIDTYTLNYTAFKYCDYNLHRDFHEKELEDGSRWQARLCRDVKLVSGSLPPGLFLLNSYQKPCGIYGIPTKSGTYTGVVDVYTYQDIYRYTLKITVEAAKCGDNAYFTLSDDGTLSISGSGSMWDFASKEEQPWYDVADRIKKVTIGSGITNVGEWAFALCENLKTVTLPSTVTKIGAYGLWNCYALTGISLPANLTSIGAAAFSSCWNMKSLTIPDKVTTIANSAFVWCDKIESLVIGSSVKMISNKAFSNCQKLKSITFRGNAPTIASDAFTNVTAAVYYPAENSTYTLKVKVGYGGNLTWGSHVTGILMTKSLEVAAGSSATPVASVRPSDAVNKKIIWTSSNPKIATVDANGKVTGVTMGRVTITAKTDEGGYKATCDVRVLFKDVTNKNLAAYDAVYWGADNGVVAGYGSYFDIDAACTRAQFVLFLWRAAGKPEPKSTNLKFKDAAEIKKLAADYTKAIAWGNEKGIVAGFTSGANVGKFCPNDPCTRGQVVLFLWRYKGKPSASAALTFADAAAIKAMAPDYAKAISWAVAKKITTGFSDNTFRPNVNCTRGQCVTFIYRVFK